MNARRPETLSKIFFVVTIDYNTNIYHSFVCCIMGNPSIKYMTMRNHHVYAVGTSDIRPGIQLSTSLLVLLCVI